jgi:phage baseplate assembly protein W
MVTGKNGAVGNVLGTGWHFPLGLERHGGLALSRLENDVEKCMRIILATARGERRMRPEFGCRVHDLVPASNDPATIGLVKQYVEEALGWWEPRIELTDVDISTDPRDAARLVIEIRYRVKATSDERSLVYPFYLAP